MFTFTYCYFLGGSHSSEEIHAQELATTSSTGSHDDDGCSDCSCMHVLLCEIILECSH